MVLARELIVPEELTDLCHSEGMNPALPLIKLWSWF